MEPRPRCFPVRRGAWVPALCACLCACLCITVGAGADAARADDVDDGLAALSLEELMQVEVRLVSRRPEALAASPAAVYVLSGDQLRRSGATTLPEALALTPGLHVAQLDANKWALSARGFNDVFANKLLVLIDGRSVYNPLFSGVFWESQDIGLDDVERVEIVRGPGGSMWGANAVNGVINVVTRSAAHSADALQAGVGAGQELGGAGARWHTRLPAGGRARWSLKTVHRRALEDADGRIGSDAWHVLRLGLRADGARDDGSTWTAAAQAYDGEAGQTFRYLTRIAPSALQDVPSHSPIRGGFGLLRWRRPTAAGSWLAQVYYDRLDRRDPPVGGVINTFDIDLQRDAAYGDHSLVWGGGYRVWWDDFDGSPAFDVVPERRTLNLFNLFAQADAHLTPSWTLSLGTRLEHNGYTGLEVQPNLRALWQPRADHTVWAALSRAVRTPSRVDADERFVGQVTGPDELFEGAPPAVFLLIGSDDFEAETVVALDGGWRAALTPRLTVDVAVYRNWYRDLRTSEPQLPGPHPELEGYLLVPLLADNRMRATSWGVEIAGATDLSRHLRLRAGYSTSRLRARLETGSLADPPTAGGSHPRHVGFAHAMWDPAPGWQADLVARGVSALPARDASGYVDLDAHLGWQLRPDWHGDLSFRNVLARNRLEWGRSNSILLATSVSPSARLSLRWDL